ncbi:hypothetical protein [Kineosporia babensis]|uniref:Uncharacterized protein n=1 Tax=Kineosporia babensis TaxID=499548 RepID=A0A9X1SUA6_9ACTN|nr:hypothetical protein [Kineosporia babensis]MCD5312747.1 hypothetical protein [Kineosporia babensis]
MSDIDDLAQSINAVGTKIGTAASEASATAQDAEDAANLMDALGAEQAATTLDQVKSELDDLAANLKAISVQAASIEALASNLSKGNGAPSFPPAASSDPAGVPTSPKKKSKGPFGRTNRRLAELTEKPGDVGDLASYTEKLTKGVVDIIKGPPKPPEITGAGTRTPDSPPIASPAATAGPDVGSAASGITTVGIFIFGVKYVVRRTIRGFRAQEQIPEEVPPPPRTRYPWEDAPEPDDR